MGRWVGGREGGSEGGRREYTVEGSKEEEERRMGKGRRGGEEGEKIREATGLRLIVLRLSDSTLIPFPSPSLFLHDRRKKILSM